jgi:hypothetical protein
MAAESYLNNTTAKVYFYKQKNDPSDNIYIFIKPTTPDLDKSNPLKKVFGGEGLGVFENVVKLSGEFFLIYIVFA